MLLILSLIIELISPLPQIGIASRISSEDDRKGPIVDH